MAILRASTAPSKPQLSEGVGPVTTKSTFVSLSQEKEDADEDDEYSMPVEEIRGKEYPNMKKGMSIPVIISLLDLLRDA